jgi:hypothetical protein
MPRNPELSALPPSLPLLSTGSRRPMAAPVLQAATLDDCGENSMPGGCRTGDAAVILAIDEEDEEDIEELGTPELPVPLDPIDDFDEDDFDDDFDDDFEEEVDEDDLDPEVTEADIPEDDDALPGEDEIDDE